MASSTYLSPTGVSTTLMPAACIALWNPRLAITVDCQASVRVAIMRYPGIGPVLGHRGSQRAKRGRAAALVDVQPVRLCSDRYHIRAGHPEQPRPQLGRGTVRAVEDNTQPGQRQFPVG